MFPPYFILGFLTIPVLLAILAITFLFPDEERK